MYIYIIKMYLTMQQGYFCRTFPYNQCLIQVMPLLLAHMLRICGTHPISDMEIYPDLVGLKMNSELNRCLYSRGKHRVHSTQILGTLIHLCDRIIFKLSHAQQGLSHSGYYPGLIKVEALHNRTGSVPSLPLLVHTWI
jgi:hypothetical protein